MREAQKQEGDIEGAHVIRKRENCPVCHESSHRTLATIITKYSPASDGLTYVYCDRCSLVFSDRVWPDDGHDLVRSNLFESKFRKYTEHKLRVNRYRKQWLEEQMHNIGRKRERERQAVCDIGTRDGSFLKLMADDGWEVLGVEPDIRYAEVARKHYGITIDEAYFDESAAIGKKFDLMCAFAVLPHIPEPVPFFEKIRSALTKDGLLYIETANVLKIQQRSLVKHHVCLYSEETLRQTLKNCNFEVVAMDASAPGGDLTFDFLRVLARARDVPSRQTEWKRVNSFEECQQAISAALQTDYPYPDPTMGRRLLHFAKGLLGEQMAGFLKASYFSLMKRVRPVARSAEVFRRLPLEIQQSYLRGELSDAQVMQIAEISDVELQMFLWRRSVSQKLTDREFEVLVRDLAKSGRRSGVAGDRKV